MIQIIKSVQKWANDRGIGSPKETLIEKWPQYEKVKEEVDEIGRALVHGDEGELIDAIGDTMVTLVILAQQNRLDISACTASAYNVIKDRKGQLIDGKFVKEEDLGLK